VRVAVLDHGMGNLRSVQKALEAAGAYADVTADADTIEDCDALCVPGQGIFGRCVSNLRASGLDGHIARWIDAGRPYLGICLGMQVLFESSEERGPIEGLGLLSGRVARLGNGVRVPHIGWNTVGDEHFYFDHSYAVAPADESIVTGWSDHGGRWAARIESGPILGVQFHPEKSGRAGIDLLRAWLANEESP
jgi:imidazole glycerol-phosphate synthase subunit HisH